MKLKKKIEAEAAQRRKRFGLPPKSVSRDPPLPTRWANWSGPGYLNNVVAHRDNTYTNCAMYGPNRLGNVDKDNFAGDLGVALEQAVAEDQKKVAEMNELNKLMGECATGKSLMSLNVGRGESTDL